MHKRLQTGSGVLTRAQSPTCNMKIILSAAGLCFQCIGWFMSGNALPFTSICSGGCTHSCPHQAQVHVVTRLPCAQQMEKPTHLGLGPAMPHSISKLSWVDDYSRAPIQIDGAIHKHGNKSNDIVLMLDSSVAVLDSFHLVSFIPGGQGAAADFREAEAIKPLSAAAQACLGKTLLALNRPAAASRMLEEAAEILVFKDPGSNLLTVHSLMLSFQLFHLYKNTYKYRAYLPFLLRWALLKRTQEPLSESSRPTHTPAT